MTKHGMRAPVLFVLALLLLVGSMYGQGGRVNDVVFVQPGVPGGGASIPVCPLTSPGTPCSPLATIYSDVTLLAPTANPITADINGNFGFYAVPGQYQLQVSRGTGFYSYYVTVPSDGTTLYDCRYAAGSGVTQLKNCVTAAANGRQFADARGLTGTIDFTGGVDITAVGTPVTIVTGPQTTWNCKQQINVGSTQACIVLRSGQYIVGPGPMAGFVIKLADGQGDNHRLIETVGTGVTGVGVSGTEIDGNKANQACGTAQSHGIALNIAVKADVYNNYIHDTCGDTVMEWGTATPSQYIEVRNNWITNPGRAGVSFISESSTSVVDNVLLTNRLFNLIHGESDDATQLNQNIIISRNFIVWTGAGFQDVGITLGGQANSGDNTSSTIVSDNILLNGATIKCQRQPYTVIKGNIVKNAKGSGITAQGRNVVAQGNYVLGNGNGTGALTVEAGIYVDSISANDTYPEAAGTSGNIVDGNFVDGFANIGIFVRFSNHASVTNNSVRNIQNNSGGADGFGIDVNGDGGGGTQSTGNVISGNRVWDDQSVPTLQKGIIVANTDKAIITSNSALNAVVANWDVATNNTGSTRMSNPGLANLLQDGLTVPSLVVNGGLSGSVVSGSSAGKAMCWKTTTTLGYCSTQPDAGGACTCN